MLELNRLEKFLTFLPAPRELHEEAKQLAETGVREAEFIVDALPSFDIFASQDGGGQEGNIAFYKEDEKVVAALVYAYDHESGLAPNIADEQEVAQQFIFNDIPAIFSPVLRHPSPFLWNYDRYPATSQHVIATVAVWNEGNTWGYSSDVHNRTDFRSNEPVNLNEMVNHLKYSFKPFLFVEEFKRSKD